MENMNTTPKYLFVGGSPRSGTTLLQNMLDSHPDIVGGPEFLHLPDILNLRKRLQHSVAQGWLNEYCNKEEADRYIIQLIDNFLLPIAKDSKISYISEKTPNNINVFKDIAELYPEAKFIQIVRDPRAVIASMLKVGQRAKKKGRQTQAFTRNILNAIDFVKHCYQKGVEAQAINGKKMLSIRYEDLVNEPERLTRQIADFLNLSWHSGMLRPDQYEHSGENAITNDIWYNKENYNRKPTDAGIDKWKKNLTTIQQLIIYYGFKDNGPLTTYGYHLGKTFGSAAAGKIAMFFGGLFYHFYSIKNKIGNRCFRPLSGIFRLSN